MQRIADIANIVDIVNIADLTDLAGFAAVGNCGYQTLRVLDTSVLAVQTGRRV